MSLEDDIKYTEWASLRPSDRGPTAEEIMRRAALRIETEILFARYRADEPRGPHRNYVLQVAPYWQRIFNERLSDETPPETPDPH